MSTRWPFESLVRDVISDLARGDYAAVERRTAGARLSAAQISAAVAEYGRRLEEPPADAPLPLDVVPVRGAEPPAWSVETPLWTVEEGRSDLTLQLTVRVAPTGGFQVEVDGIHVP